MILLLAAVLAIQSPAEQGYRKAVELYRQGSFAAAQRELEAALRADPKHLHARLQLARTLVRQERVADALVELQAVEALHPDDPEAAFQAGKLLQELAASRLERLERMAADSAELRELLGKQQEARGELDKALEQYRAARQREPNRKGVHFLIGNVLWKMGERDAALEELVLELRGNPAHTQAHLRAGQILMAAGDPARAIAHLERAVEGQPKLLEARRELGRALRQAGRLDEALVQLQAVAAARPEDDTVHAQLGAVYRAKGDESRARAELEIHRRILARKQAAARESFEQQRR